MAAIDGGVTVGPINGQRRGLRGPGPRASVLDRGL